MTTHKKPETHSLGAKASPKTGGGYEIGTGKWKTPWWAHHGKRGDRIERTQTPAREQTPQEIETQRDQLDRAFGLGKYTPGARPAPHRDPNLHIIGSSKS
jgi:hypothetical protein